MSVTGRSVAVGRGRSRSVAVGRGRSRSVAVGRGRSRSVGSLYFCMLSTRLTVNHQLYVVHKTLGQLHPLHVHHPGVMPVLHVTPLQDGVDGWVKAVCMVRVEGRRVRAGIAL